MTILCISRHKTDKEKMFHLNFLGRTEFSSSHTYTANIPSYILHFAYFNWTTLCNHLSWLHLITFSIVFMLCICIVFMQATSQSLVTQLTKQKMFFDASNERIKTWSQGQLKKTKILHAGHNSQQNPVTTIHSRNMQ